MRKELFAIGILFVVGLSGLAIYEFYNLPEEPSFPLEDAEIKTFETAGEEEFPKEEEIIGPSEEELTKWNTYSAKKFGFEVRYPENWTAGSGVNDYQEAVILNSFPEPILGEDNEEFLGPRIVVAFFGLKNVQDLSVDRLSVAGEEKQKEDGWQMISKDDVILKSFPAKKLIFSKDGKYAIYYLFLKDDNVYKIIAEFAEEKPELINKFYQILSTFKFL